MKCKLFITDVYLNSCLLLQTNDDNVIDRGVLKYLPTNVESQECKRKKKDEIAENYRFSSYFKIAY